MSLAKHRAKMAELSKFTAKAGWFDTAKYPDGTPVAKIAKIQNDGSVIGENQHIPARPFMHNAESDMLRGKGRDSLVKLTKKFADPANDMTPAQFMGNVGLIVERAIVKSIVDGEYTPLAESTIKAKGQDKPLIDTKLMWKSVTSKVDVKN